MAGFCVGYGVEFGRWVKWGGGPVEWGAVVLWCCKRCLHWWVGCGHQGPGVWGAGGGKRVRLWSGDVSRKRSGSWGCKGVQTLAPVTLTVTL